MEKEYELNIYDLIKAALDFIKAPDSQEAVEEVEWVKSKMIIKEYMPLRQKEVLLMKALFDMQNIDEAPYHFTTAKEIALLFDCLLPYVTNLDPDIGPLIKDYDTFDIIFSSGIAQHILDHCEKDYTRIRDMFDSTINFSNIQKMLIEINNFSPESVDRMTRSFEEFVEAGDSKLFEKVSEILASNDSLYTQIKEKVQESALASVNSVK